MSTPAIEARGLVKRFGSRAAVDGLSFEVPSGTVFALLGPNGAGKSTTLSLCQGFRRPDDGSVRVLGLDPHRQVDRLKPRIGVMPQENGAYLAARAGEMLRLVAGYSRHPHRPADLLALLGLTDSARTPIRRLSGGQRQRLALALAVVGRPELVFLDEPTAGLDPQARHTTWDLIAAMRADGVTVVLTTHLMAEAERLADDILVIDHGVAVAHGTPAELTRTDNTALRFRAEPALDVAAMTATLPAGCVATEPEPGRYLVTGDIGPDALAAVTAWCAARGVMAADLATTSRTLEDVFLELTGRELR